MPHVGTSPLATTLLQKDAERAAALGASTRPSHARSALASAAGVRTRAEGNLSQSSRQFFRHSCFPSSQKNTTRTVPRTDQLGYLSRSFRSAPLSRLSPRIIPLPA